VGYVRRRISVPFLLVVLACVAVGGALAGWWGDDGGNEAPGQEELSQDADAKVAARTAQGAIETYNVEKAAYTGATPEELAQREPALADFELTVEAQPGAYELTVESETSNTFTVSRDPTGLVVRRCETPGDAGCPGSGQW
jgi:hypothetical protein